MKYQALVGLEKEKHNLKMSSVANFIWCFKVYFDDFVLNKMCFSTY